MKHISPLLPRFHQRYPDITLEVIAANRYVDLLDSDIDLAIRTREFEPDANIAVRRLATTRRILAAATAASAHWTSIA